MQSAVEGNPQRLGKPEHAPGESVNVMKMYPLDAQRIQERNERKVILLSEKHCKALTRVCPSQGKAILGVAHRAKQKHFALWRKKFRQVAHVPLDSAAPRMHHVKQTSARGSSEAPEIGRKL